MTTRPTIILAPAAQKPIIAAVFYALDPNKWGTMLQSAVTPKTDLPGGDTTHWLSAGDIEDADVDALVAMVGGVFSELPEGVTWEQNDMPSLADAQTAFGFMVVSPSYSVENPPSIAALQEATLTALGLQQLYYD